MAIVSYTPSFQHEDWVDNVDRVQAGGANGFNVRFNAIEGEFQKLGQAVQTIDTALGSLGEPARGPVTIGLAPILFPFGDRPQWTAISWGTKVQPQGFFTATHVEKPFGPAEAWGILPLDLPHGVRLIQLRVLGNQGPGAVTMRTSLIQEARFDPFTQTTLVTIAGFDSGSTPPTPIPGMPRLDVAANLYYLQVAVTEAGPGVTIHFRGCLLTYQP
jgi:hypothetical protein